LILLRNVRCYNDSTLDVITSSMTINGSPEANLKPASLPMSGLAPARQAGAQPLGTSMKGKYMRWGPILAAASMLSLGNAVHAQTVDVAATSRGSYIQTGVFGTGGAGQPDGNYITGFHEGDEYRSFFVFVLPDVAEITGATLDFQYAGFSNVSGPLTLLVYEYNGDASALMSGLAGTAGFDDLGSGTLFGSLEIPLGINSFSVSLNSSAVASLNAHAGGVFAIGGRASSALPGEQFVFGGTLVSPPVFLSLSVVPEPASWVLLLVGFTLIAVRVRRQLATAKPTRSAAFG